MSYDPPEQPKPEKELTAHKAYARRGRLETKEHVLKAVLHNEENPGAVPMGRNRHERRAIAAAVRKGKRALAKVKKQMVKP